MPSRCPSLSLLLALCGPSLPAQCFEPNFGPPAATPQQLTGGVVLPIRPIGFVFPLGAVAYTDVYICDKGYVWLSNGGFPAPGGADFSPTQLEFAQQSPRIAPLWADIEVRASNGGMIHMDTTPGRTVITWAGARCHQGRCGPFDLQLQLFSNGSVLCFHGAGAINLSNPAQPAWQPGISGISPGFTLAVPPASDLSAGGASASPLTFERFAGGTFDMAGRGLEFTPTASGYTFQRPPNCASGEAYGVGCVDAADSWHEFFSSGFDLHGYQIQWVRTPTGYVVDVLSADAFQTPGPTAVPIAPGVLDGQRILTLPAPMPAPFGPVQALRVTTKGYVDLVGTPEPQVDFSPTVQELLDAAATRFCCWHDYDQTAPGSGTILSEIVAGVLYLTWLDVHSYQTGLPNTFQFQFELATGNVGLAIVRLAGATLPDPLLLGFSAGGFSPDPGATDLSAVASFAVRDLATGLRLAPIGWPRVGTPGFALITRNMTDLAPFGVMFVGDAALGQGLDPIGMPGCQALSNAALAAATFAVAQGQGTWPLPIPGTASLVGLELFAQSLGFSDATPLGLATSNGVRLQIGN